MKEMCNDFTPDSCSSPYPMPINAIPAEDEDSLMGALPLSEAYVPFQPYTTPMSKEQSLICGTVFSELLNPYCSGWHLHSFGREV